MPERAKARKKSSDKKWVAGLWAANKAFRIAIVVAVLVAVASAFSAIAFRTVSVRSSRTVELAFKNIGEMATQEVMFTNVQVIDESRKIGSWAIPFTTSKIIFSYDGSIKAGFDFSQIDIQTDELLKTVKINCPELRILSIEVYEDSLNIYDEAHSAFTPIDITNYSETISLLKEEASSKTINGGLFDKAKSQAEAILTGIVSGFVDLTEYTIKFAWEE